MTADLQTRPSSSTGATRLSGVAAERRRRWRRRLLLAGLLPLLVAVALAGKVGTMLWADHAGRGDYGSVAYDDARGWFGWNRHVDVLERWVAPYDEGTARIRLADFPAAVDDLGAALDVVPPAQECRVRINLSIAREGVGDDLAGRGDLAAARLQWQAGVTVLAEGGCRRVAPDAAGSSTRPTASASAGADPSASADDSLLDQALDATAGASSAAQAATATAVDARLQRKLDQALAAALAQTAQAASGAADTPAGELAERNQRGDRQQVRNEQHRQDLADAQGQQDPSATATTTAGAAPTYHW